MYDEQLLDDIYEAAIRPELWKVLLNRLTALVGGVGSLMFSFDGFGASNLLYTDSISYQVNRWFSEGWAAPEVNVRNRLTMMREPRFLTDSEIFTLDEMEQFPIYRDFIWKVGLGWVAGTSIYAPTGDRIVFSLEREKAKGPYPAATVDALTAIRPHLARAALLSARAADGRLQAAVLALEAVGLPAAVLNGARRVRAANKLFETNPYGARIGAKNALSFDRPGPHRAFEAATLSPTSSMSIALPPSEGRAPAVLHLLPMRRSALDIFDGGVFLVYITGLTEKKAAPDAILQALFDLTPAEAKVAGQIGQGRTVEEIAAAFGLNANTVRAHLKSVFAKTGVRRQAELARLITL